MSNPRDRKHEDRAVAAMALDLCATHFTDGFCTPTHRQDCKCVKHARSCLEAMKTVGVKPVWMYDQEPEHGPS